MNKTIITIELPKHGADKLLKGWKDKDPELLKAFEELKIEDIKPVEENERPDPSDG